jgi:hypothetical protein
VAVTDCGGVRAERRNFLAEPASMPGRDQEEEGERETACAAADQQLAPHRPVNEAPRRAP